MKKTEVKKIDKKVELKTVINSFLEALILCAILYVIVGPYNRVYVMLLDAIYESKISLSFCFGTMLPLFLILFGTKNLMLLVLDKNKAKNKDK